MARRRGSKGTKRYEVLAAIRQNPRASLRELAAQTGLKSISNVHYHLMSLEQDGLITRESRLARSIQVGEQKPVKRSQRYDKAGTRAKKAAGGRKARILEKTEKGVAGIDAETWKRIEKIGRREDRRKKQHTTDVILDFHPRATSLKCHKLG